MKRINKAIRNILLFALLTISNIPIYAQVEEEIKLPDIFPTEDAVWIIEEKITTERSWANPETGLWYDVYIKNYSYYLEGDTIIYNKKYSKLYVKDISNNLHYGYVGGIRIEGKKVYFDPVDFDYETLVNVTGGMSYIFEEEGIFNEFCMYDFSLDKGDEFITGTFLDDTGSPYCTPIEMYNWGNNDIQERWIEGIGSIEGLWHYSVTSTTGFSQRDVWYTLKSFHYKGKQFYPTEESGINETPKEENITKAYVSDGVLYIESAEDINSVTVYDAMGRIITSGTYSNASLQIPLPTTLKGVVMVKVNNEVVKVICE